jgi:hypothetical protein
MCRNFSSEPLPHPTFVVGGCLGVTSSWHLPLLTDTVYRVVGLGAAAVLRWACCDSAATARLLPRFLQRAQVSIGGQSMQQAKGGNIVARADWSLPHPERGSPNGSQRYRRHPVMRKQPSLCSHKACATSLAWFR